MSRYIDADAIKGKKVYSLERHEWVVPVAEIDWQTTADVAEVRHAGWKKVSEKYPRYVCTSCNHLYNNKEYKYCPYCGANMRGKRTVDNEAVWDKNMEMLRSGRFGSMNGNECYETLLKYWKAQEEAGFPMASENVKYFDDILGRKEE